MGVNMVLSTLALGLAGSFVEGAGGDDDDVGIRAFFIAPVNNLHIIHISQSRGMELIQHLAPGHALVNVDQGDFSEQAGFHGIGQDIGANMADPDQDQFVSLHNLYLKLKF